MPNREAREPPLDGVAMVMVLLAGRDRGRECCRPKGLTLLVLLLLQQLVLPASFRPSQEFMPHGFVQGIGHRGFGLALSPRYSTRMFVAATVECSHHRGVTPALQARRKARNRVSFGHPDCRLGIFVDGATYFPCSNVQLKLVAVSHSRRVPKTYDTQTRVTGQEPPNQSNITNSPQPLPPS
ncbi:hypothetical protein TPAR_05062 [Tolypocladium paradoxum]|uniref:Secreted protein n=1 Tax=Tolypocladium paradoxum TaxID=94208 RepID=A0A2S4KX11_9HYPO|nr:hypothetical protein TPAR_05062 [Tolypocladium paradoxum]